ncbi:sodium-dependent noradrenaline transporter [Xylaria bambusicola]|uniref:sodium-dependent noradrenaline transporter n=1 Tax=Xylaria bambusicola TaxID=326684 RepID=UPI002007A7D2|nr:sodium-dependent noradrenaline transporter [Xylaria bambusicola]KAI0506737.1 sodium-dependent noradrenaline transporter [Xylaria bambusicola]
MVGFLQKIGRWLAPPPAKSADGRDQWPSRAAFLLAAMGGCAGQGNLIRYPSVVYNNYGLQWFIPYLAAVFFVAIPALVLEIAIGQAYRGGTVIAFNNINRRLKGVGLSSVLVSFVVCGYFVTNLSWIMHYFRSSFQSPLPWEGRINEFYNDDVIANPDPIMGSLTEGNAAVASYTSYPSIGLVVCEPLIQKDDHHDLSVGWSAFIWFLIWFSIFRGVGMTGRVVYFTMGVPIITTLIIVGRATSLENAGAGIRLVWATWRGDQLKSGTVWQTAVGQVFFSTGIGFGYFTSYASYNAKHSNAVMDAILICFSNVVFENVAAFAVFGIVGFLRLWPQDGVRLGAFVVGFLTLPEAVLHLPGANFWAVLLFLTLIVLGFSSAFVLIDAAATLIMDSGLKISRAVVVTGLTLLSFLLCLPYCTQFGYYLLDGVDRWVNNILLIFVVWAEVVSATSVYRWSDVVSQTGVPAFATYNVGYLGAQIIGVSVAHGLGNPGAGAGAGFGFYIVISLVAIFLSNAPDVNAPSFWNSNSYLARFWYLAFYSGNQLRRDLNVVVGVGKNWTIPSFLPVLLRYVSGPTLAIILSFAYPEFYKLRYDPLMITGFTLTHILLAATLLGFIIPRYYDIFIPPSRLGEGTEVTVVGQSKLDVPEIEAGHEDSIGDAGSVPSEEKTGRTWTKLWRTKS